MSRPTPQRLTEFAYAIHRTTQASEGMERWREMVQQWGDEYVAAQRPNSAWERERNAHGLRILSNPRLLSDREHSPESGWQWEENLVQVTKDDLPFDHSSWPIHAPGVCLAKGWVPPKLASQNRPASGLPLPLRPAEEIATGLSINAKAAALAAVHDKFCKGTAPINPRSAQVAAAVDKAQCLQRIGWRHLQTGVKELTDDDVPALEAWLEEVRAALPMPTHTPDFNMSDKASRPPWYVQPGLERSLPLANAISAAGEVLGRYGECIANGKHPQHVEAWRKLKQCLERVGELWEERKLWASQGRRLTFSELQSLDNELTEWSGALSQIAMHWQDWGSYVASGAHERTLRLSRRMQELEKHLYTIGATPATPAPTSKPEAAVGAWKPPEGYVGTKRITMHEKFQKRGKNPTPSTIQRWVERAEREDKRVNVVQAPDTHENFYPELWLLKQIERWSPRSAPEAAPPCPSDALA